MPIILQLSFEVEIDGTFSVVELDRMACSPYVQPWIDAALFNYFVKFL